MNKVLDMYKKLESKEKTLNDLQSRINKLYQASGSASLAVNMIRASAITASAEYPQYYGAYNKLKLCLILHNIDTKLGMAFVKGDIAAIVPHEGDIDSIVVYSVRNGIKTHIDKISVEII